MHVLVASMTKDGLDSVEVYKMKSLYKGWLVFRIQQGLALVEPAQVRRLASKRQLSSLLLLLCTTGCYEHEHKQIFVLGTLQGPIFNHATSSLSTFTCFTSFMSITIFTSFNILYRHPKSVRTLQQLNSLYLVTSGVPDRLTKLQNLVGLCVRFCVFHYICHGCLGWIFK